MIVLYLINYLLDKVDQNYLNYFNLISIHFILYKLLFTKHAYKLYEISKKHFVPYIIITHLFLFQER